MKPQTPPYKIIEAVGLVFIILGLFTCVTFLFHSDYAYFGPAMIGLGICLMCGGRYMYYRLYSKLENSYDRHVDDVEAPVSSEEQQQRTSINSQNVSVAYSTNGGYAASQQGV
uniref:Uncharacterized protein n=1 Tax=Clytia hemisphaerica TaxID=252671 RepID=A0A7M5V5E4_9CNID